MAPSPTTSSRPRRQRSWARADPAAVTAKTSVGEAAAVGQPRPRSEPRDATRQQDDARAGRTARVLLSPRSNSVAAHAALSIALSLIVRTRSGRAATVVPRQPPSSAGDFDLAERLPRAPVSSGRVGDEGRGSRPAVCAHRPVYMRPTTSIRPDSGGERPAVSRGCRVRSQ